MKAYLAGAIEYSPDHGEAWRTDMSAFIIERLGHEVYNPLWEEFKYLSPDESRNFRALKTIDTEAFKRSVRKLIDGDLNSIREEIDYIVCLWDKFAAMGGGTYGELTMAYSLGKPVYMVSRLPIREISGWILGCTTRIFDSFEDLKKHLSDRYGRAAVE